MSSYYNSSSTTSSSSTNSSSNSSSNNYNNLTLSTPEIFNDFSSNRYVDGTRDFLQSNSLIAKISFFLLVILLFVVLLKIGIALIYWFLSPNPNPILIDGMIDATQMMTIPATPVIRSDNQNDGIEFTWSVWLFIKDTVPNTNYQHVFHKGNYSFQTNGLNQPNNAPGLYLNPDSGNTKSLTVIMNTFHTINEQIVIHNIPLNKWLNVIIRCKNKTIDVYINGMISNSFKLKDVPKQNFGDTYVCANGGFSGFVSNLTYYDYALGINKIQGISHNGPNTTMASGTMSSNTFSEYLSLRWFFSGDGTNIEDSYNP